MTAQKRALVIGGSVGGLFAASLFRQAGWDAIVFERSRDDLAGRGAGIGVTQELIDTMQRIGARFNPSIGVASSERLWIDASGEIRHREMRESVGSAWSGVYRALRQSFPDSIYHPGTALARVEQTDDSVTAIFQDGTRVEGDLLVAADGNQSTVRAQFLPEAVPSYAGYVAWRGVVPPELVSRDTLELLNGRIIYSFSDHHMMLTMMVPGGEGHEDQRHIYYAWYRPTTSEADLRNHFTDASGRHYGFAIAPPLIRPELISMNKEQASSLFCPAVAEVVRSTPQPLLQAISDFETPKMAIGRIAILGDAAYVARPHVAAGITKAALDATRLADALERHGADVPSALADYEAAQMDFGRRIVAHARRLGSYVQPGADGNRLSDPVQVMGEYGAPHLVHDADVTPFLSPRH